MSATKEIKIKLKIQKIENQLRFVKSRKAQRQLAIELTRLEGELEKTSASRPKADAFIFSKPVVGKVLNIETQYIESISADGENATAMIAGKPHLVTKRRAIMAIASMRKERSRTIKVIKDNRNPSIFKAENGNSKYTLFLHPRYIRCNCPDHQTLVEKLETNQVACKHVYALLGTLGHNSLSEYVKTQSDFKKLTDGQVEKEAFESLGFDPPKRLLSDHDIEDRLSRY